MARKKKFAPNDNNLAIAYYRFSSHSQNEASIDQQRELAREWADAHGFKIVQEYEDAAISGTTDARPGFQQMLSEVAKIRPHTLIMWKTDRLGRDKYVLAMAKKKIRDAGCEIHLLAEHIPTEGPEGVLIEGLMEAMAEYYSRQLSQNIQRGMDYNAQHALYNGHKLFGYDVDRSTKKYIPDPNTAPFVQWAFREYASGKPLKTIAEEMNAQGVCFLDMGPVFDSLGHPPEFSSRVDNHYGLLGAYETYRAAVQKLNGDYGLALSFPEEGTDVTFSALPNPYMGSRTRKLLGLRGDDEKLLTAAFREDIPFTRLDNWQEVASAVYALPATEDEALTYGLYMGGDIAETCIRTDRSSLPTALIFGDSFTNAVESLAYYSFDEMRSVDLRHYKTQSISDYIAAYQPDVVICIRDYEALLSRSDNGGLS